MNICFTGHRPDKLGGYNWNTKKNKDIILTLKSCIIDAINEPEDAHFTFISGGALGIDQMAFEICYDIKYYELKLNPVYIELEYAIPFEKQDCKWKEDDVLRYNIQKSRADIVTYVDTLGDYKIKGYQEDIYYPAKMQKRNEYMVDKSDLVIAVWDGTKGGTGNCVKYAQKQGKKILRLDPNTLKTEIIN